MAERVLLDTGFLVALVNRADRDHARCRSAWEPLRAEVITVEGVLVEACWLLRKDRRGPQAAVDLALAGGARIVPLSEPRLRRTLALMQRYANVPMDFVDAALVAVAEEEDVHQVLTLDRRGFETYRARSRRGFSLLP